MYRPHNQAEQNDFWRGIWKIGFVFLGAVLVLSTLGVHRVGWQIPTMMVIVGIAYVWTGLFSNDKVTDAIIFLHEILIVSGIIATIIFNIVINM